MEQTYATPDDAARGDIPERYARTVGRSISPSGDCAVVLQLTNEGAAVEPYQTVCYRNEDGTWSPGAGGNGGGGAPMQWEAEPEDRRYVVTSWDQVPDGVIEVVVRWRDEEHRVPVEHGWYFFTRWGVPEEDFDPWVDEVARVHADGSEELLEPSPQREAMRERHRELMARAREEPPPDLATYEARWFGVSRLVRRAR